MTNDPKDLDRVIAGLSEAQKYALRGAAECKGGEWWTPYRTDDIRLSRLGQLTPLGLAVRTRLQETEK